MGAFLAAWQCHPPAEPGSIPPEAGVGRVQGGESAWRETSLYHLVSVTVMELQVAQKAGGVAYGLMGCKAGGPLQEQGYFPWACPPALSGMSRINGTNEHSYTGDKALVTTPHYFLSVGEKCP